MLSREKGQQTSTGRYSIYDASVSYYATVKLKKLLVLNSEYFPHIEE
jgi:hypothetical protein